jgi:YidC/Oxa1 family membrane protein insertase
MSDPFDLVCSYINNIHVAWDVPYWHSIMIGTLGLRLVILPVALRTMQNAGRLAVVQPLVKAKVDEANANKDDKELYTKLMLEGRDIYAQHNVNPVLSLLLPFVQMPLFVSFFFGLQRMVEIFPDYTSGGTLWFENLAVADPTYMLPIINGFTFFLVFESNSDLKAKQPQMMIFFRAMALFMIPITATFQSVRYCMRAAAVCSMHCLLNIGIMCLLICVLILVAGSAGLLVHQQHHHSHPVQYCSSRRRVQIPEYSQAPSHTPWRRYK